MTTAEQNLILLESLIPASEKFYVWCYEKDGNCKATSCPEDSHVLLDQTFRRLGGVEKMLRYAEETEGDVPLLVGSSIGLQWAVTLESERNNSLIFVIGPVFYHRPDTAQVRNTLQAEYRTPADSAWIDALCNHLQDFPAISYPVFCRYMLMVHNTLTGKRLDIDAFEKSSEKTQLSVPSAAPARDRIKVYQAEQALLEMVRKGDINYFHAFNTSIGLSPGVPVQGRDPLRQMKTSITVFVTLVSRAAMEGGLSPEVAYSLGDSYIQAVEDCRDSGDLTALAHAMYHDFIYRVHHLRTHPGCSHAIQKCCDYIELSLDRKIRAADLAALVGYTEYYLTEKFKKETGQSVSSYIRQAKINRAMILLRSTDKPVHVIADELAFNTPNYFIQSFRESVGLTPAQYRQQQGDA